MLNFSRSAISAFIPRTDETSSENHKTLSRFDFERLLILLGYLETDYQITVSNCTAELGAMAKVEKGMRCHEASKTENVFVLFRAQHTGRRDWINWTPGL